MTRKKLDDKEIHKALEGLPGWKIKNGKLHKSFKFDSFAEAIGWMVSVGVYADGKDHHPDWSNSYNRVEVDLSTHDMDDAISNLDVDLAQKMNSLAA